MCALVHSDLSSTSSCWFCRPPSRYLRTFSCALTRLTSTPGSSFLTRPQSIFLDSHLTNLFTCFLIICLELLDFQPDRIWPAKYTYDLCPICLPGSRVSLFLFLLNSPYWIHLSVCGPLCYCFKHETWQKHTVLFRICYPRDDELNVDSGICPGVTVDVIKWKVCRLLCFTEPWAVSPWAAAPLLILSNSL